MEVLSIVLQWSIVFRTVGNVQSSQISSMIVRGKSCAIPLQPGVKVSKAVELLVDSICNDLLFHYRQTIGLSFKFPRFLHDDPNERG